MNAAREVTTPAEVVAQYKQRPPVLTPEVAENLDWDLIARAGNKAQRAALVAAHGVEAAVPWGYAPYVRAMLKHHKHAIEGTHIWEQQEQNHAALLARCHQAWQRHVSLPELPLAPVSSVKKAIYPLFGFLTRLRLRWDAPLLYAVWGASQERLTHAFYLLVANSLRETASRADAELARCLELIAKEEAIHMAYYGQLAQAYIAQSADTHAAIDRMRRRLIDHWMPVGSDVLSRAQYKNLTRVFLGSGGGEIYFRQHVLLPLSRLLRMPDEGAAELGMWQRILVAAQ